MKLLDDVFFIENVYKNLTPNIGLYCIRLERALPPCQSKLTLNIGEECADSRVGAGKDCSYSTESAQPENPFCWKDIIIQTHAYWNGHPLGGVGTIAFYFLR